jgi:hypothetical protein
MHTFIHKAVVNVFNLESPIIASKITPSRWLNIYWAIVRCRHGSMTPPLSLTTIRFKAASTSATAPPTLPVCMYVCMYVCVYVCIYVWQHDASTKSHNNAIQGCFNFINRSPDTPCVYVCMYVCMCVCMYLYMYGSITPPLSLTTIRLRADSTSANRSPDTPCVYMPHTLAPNFWYML